MADTKKVLTWVGIGCGTLFLVVTGSCVGLYYYGKSKIDQATKELGIEPGKDGQGFATAMMIKGLEMMGPQVKGALPASEQASFDTVMTGLKAKASKLSKQDFERLSQAVQTYSQSTRTEGRPTPESARQLVQELQAIVDAH